MAIPSYPTVPDTGDSLSDALLRRRQQQLANKPQGNGVATGGGATPVNPGAPGGVAPAPPMQYLPPGRTPDQTQIPGQTSGGFGSQAAPPPGDDDHPAPPAPPQVPPPAPPPPADTPPPATAPPALPPPTDHNGTWNGYTRESWRDEWMSQGQMSAAQMDAWMAAHGATKLSENGTFRTPFGEVLDLGIGYKTGRPTPGFGGTGGAGGTGSGDGTGPGGAGGYGALWDILMKRAGASLNLDPNDPIIKAQVNAFRAEQQRASRDYVDRAAERGSNQNLNMETRMANENIGQSTGAFEASLMQKELTAQRDQIATALQQAIQYGTAQQQMALQEKLAQLNNAIDWARLQQQAYQFDIDDEFRRSPLAS